VNNTLDLQKIADELEFDLEDVEMLLEVFLEGVQENLVELKNGIDSNDYEAIFRAGHAIKGSSANLTLNNISNLAKEIESNARAGQSINYEEYYDKLKLLIDSITV